MYIDWKTMNTADGKVTENLRDGNDCLSEGMKAFRRLKKISPADAPLIDQALSHVSSARELVLQLEADILKRTRMF
ncbi:hypothetical protein CSQ92_10065 [Janthinobacterium sp. BJB446]|jgi:hypothetical protein|nr:hypothetical protein CSQ92_10065 [Janthinobacterium sp. BJB446]